ncbi:YlbL family protein [Corynebacterium suicordis]|uniref:endopeptidase La n=1 Tax=Corynebacterium suicordis DSM 45110 TaxID=1121369 RepID=A0ABR9ZI07_9CORY|nr:PDZ domain-containing protein [Corynebacterium suicordis]MBF4553060.1 PDZ domain-containing protein [Corynebacterium suicordis DSM 45110]MDR6277978.1 PDZ domain-containing protein [Corynebacterium suicordis]
MSFWNRRSRTVVIGAVPVVLLVSLIGLPTVPGTDVDLTVPYAAQGKGPTFNTLGEFNGKQVVEIKGEKPDETSGNLNMTTVSVRTNMTLAQALGRWMFSDDVLVPIEQIFPPGQSQEAVQEKNAVAFASSESNATISAMNYLKRPTEVMVMQISDDSPASGEIHINDIVRKVDGVEITKPDQLAEEVRKHQPGDKIPITLFRQEREIEKQVELGTIPESLREKSQDDSVPFLGVTTVAQPAGDLTVEYNLTDVGGPSAGLMFSLAVVDKLSPGELSGGRFVAGTGTIDANGEVGPIGGIAHKIRAAADEGAEVFLVPADNCSEAKTAERPEIKLVKVDSLEDAVGDLNAINSGAEPSLCD